MASQTTRTTAVGKRPVRHDGYDKVTGKALYGADTNLPGRLHGRKLRSPHAHARITSINTVKAEAHPEVHSVITNSDFPPQKNESVAAIPGPAINLKQQTDNILAGSTELQTEETSCQSQPRSTQQQPKKPGKGRGEGVGWGPELER